MRLPLAAVEIRDRESFADALVAYGKAALGELTGPAVIATNRLAIAEAGRSSEMGRILEQDGREPNRKALVGLMAKAQAAGVLTPGDPNEPSTEFFSLLMGDLMIRLLLGVTPRPGAREIARRAEAATVAVLALHARRRHSISICESFANDLGRDRLHHEDRKRLT